MPVVVDASALIAILFDEPEGPAVQARLPASGLAATTLTAFEVANTAVQKVRRGSVTAEKADAAIALFGAMAIDFHAVPATALVPLARKSGLTAYDAGYLSERRTAIHAAGQGWQRQAGIRDRRRDTPAHVSLFCARDHRARFRARCPTAAPMARAADGAG